MSHQSAAGIAASVDEQPAAVGTDPEPCDGVVAQQRQRRNRQRRLEGDRRRGSPNGLPGSADLVRLPDKPIGAGPQERRADRGRRRCAPSRPHCRNSRSVSRGSTARRGAIASRRRSRTAPPPSSSARKPPAASAKRAISAGSSKRSKVFVRIAAQHHRVRRVERKQAAGRSVGGPGHRHADNSNR